MSASAAEKGAERLLRGMPLTTEQAADITCKHPKTIRRWIIAGKIHAVLTPSRTYLIPAAEIRRVITGERAALRAGPGRPRAAAPGHAAPAAGRLPDRGRLQLHAGADRGTLAVDG